MSGKYHKNSSATIIESFDFALKGLVYAVKTQRNMRIHLIIAILVIMISLFLNLSRIEIILLIITVMLVLITELLNTAMELMVNLITEEHHPLAKIIKDMSAGIVLFSSIAAAIIGYILFVRKETLQLLESAAVINKISAFPPYASAVIVFLVLVVTVYIKGMKSKDPSLEGGMPSIHTAVAFSLASIIYFISGSFYTMLLSFLLASMVAQSRISSRIHSFWEVAAGAMLGTALTVFVFQVLM